MLKSEHKFLLDMILCGHCSVTIDERTVMTIPNFISLLWTSVPFLQNNGEHKIQKHSSLTCHLRITHFTKYRPHPRMKLYKSHFVPKRRKVNDRTSFRHANKRKKGKFTKYCKAACQNRRDQISKE